MSVLGLSLGAKLLREPLAHFLFLGAAIFGIHALIAERPPADAENRIMIGAGDVEQLRTTWTNKWQRPPAADELKGLIEARIREEVLYREALALGLDRDDTIVRGRLAQKFQFLAEDLAASRDPTDAELAAYFEANRERYRVPFRLSFIQVYFNPDLRGAAAERDAGVALASLRAGSRASTAAGLGDGVMLDDAYRRQSAQDIEAVFGRGFSDAMFGLDVGVWSGPIASGYGLHLVRVEERVAGRIPPLSEVEEQVRADWSYDERRQANEAIFQRLRVRYEVVVEGGVP
jgi:hypothetical protein